MTSVTPAQWAQPPHGPGWVGEDNCWHHGYEPIPEDYYILCFECGHCYATPDDLRRAYRQGIEKLITICGADVVDPLIVPPATEIYFCQECVHDF